MAIYKLTVVRSKISERVMPYCSSSDFVFKRFQKQFQNYDREHFIIFHLNTQNQIIDQETISIGTLDTAYINCRDVLKGAILANSAAVILAHNHPSGCPKPSQSDNNITKRLLMAFKIFDIKVLDHIIFGDDNYYSYNGEGLIQLWEYSKLSKGELK